jgi:hypothetical protein
MSENGTLRLAPSVLHPVSRRAPRAGSKNRSGVILGSVSSFTFDAYATKKASMHLIGADVSRNETIRKLIELHGC